MNLDPRSLKHNTEIGVYCESPEIAADVVTDLESRLDAIAWRVVATTDPAGHGQLEWIQTHADGTTTELDAEPEVSAARRMQIWFLGLLPIESQL